MRKGPGSVYDKWNIFVIICDTDIGKILFISDYPFKETFEFNQYKYCNFEF
jgi:hypothetical protein